jgi:chromosome segregation ATPase
VNHPVIIAYVSGGCALIMLLWNIFFAPSRADKKELEKRLNKLELDDANHEARLTGFSQNMERQNDRWEERCNKIEGQLSEVGRMREDLAVVKTKLEGYGESITEMKGTLSKIFDLLRTK